MGYSKTTVILFLVLAFAMAATPALSVVGNMPNPSLCLEEISNTPGCLSELRSSLGHKHLNLRRGCCEANKGMSHKCRDWFFNQGKYTPAYGKQVKDYCAQKFGITSAPTSQAHNHLMKEPSHH
ncbi:hypothetical protein CCACVL1_15164 [Corchorus capsularis]|uniref:Prolamin-like domain-containing protein n=1 Tax=Corchorus capsularis TaxID=210143 RepID=A0A1R3I3P2_COCAP|nr:hypothetical protein CCACVL1_15164 [Corchorus capsularis]